MSTELIKNWTTTHCGNATCNRNVTRFASNNTLEDNSITKFAKADLPSVEALKLSFEVFIALFGVVGNVFVTVIISRLGKKKTAADFYLLNLAIADLGFLLLTLPLSVIKEKVPFNWPLGEFFCLYLSPVPEIFYGSSIWFITIVAIQRHRKIVALQVKRDNSKKTSLRTQKIIVGFVWVISYFIFSLPLHIVVKYVENGHQKLCGPMWPLWDTSWILPRLYASALTFFSYILPLSIIALTYLGIAREISRSSKFLKNMKMEQNGDSKASDKVLRWSKEEAQRLQQNRRVRKVLTPLVLVFGLTMLPVNMIRIIFVSWPAIAVQTYYNNLLYVVVVFVVINSSANPVIYSLVSKNFRKALKELLPRGRCMSCNLLSRSWQPSNSSHHEMSPFYVHGTFKISEPAIKGSTSQTLLLELSSYPPPPPRAPPPLPPPEING